MRPQTTLAIGAWVSVPANVIAAIPDLLSALQAREEEVAGRERTKERLQSALAEALRALMGREVRRVPADWQHPKYPDDHYEHHLRGRYVPLYGGGAYASAAADWDAEWSQWQVGLVRSYANGERWRPKEGDERGMRYTEYAGSRPSPDDYMPDWPADQRTHLMMYEDTSEGTPKSPAFETPEELARWCADNGVSAFGYDTATYEQWLNVARGGWAPSAVLAGGVLMSGVAAMGTNEAASAAHAAEVEGEGSRDEQSPRLEGDQHEQG